MMLSNFDIENICKELKLPIVGVYSKDRLPEIPYIGSYYINMQNYHCMMMGMVLIGYLLEYLIMVKQSILIHTALNHLKK
jgi:hypothetical protein